ncbi:2-hydroxyacid dehydrogenase [Pseudomonas putida BIRD-1]|nr:2-hydroxyacid dehydrogenase [Pseudomonas putida BIRD-1]
MPDALKALPNTVLTPHVAGQSPEAARDTVDLVLRNLQAFFAGEPVLTPVRP